MHYGDDSEDQVKKNEPCNYTSGFDCVYRSYVRDYTQGIKRLFGGRRMKCESCKIELEPPYYITCQVCNETSCMTHGIQIPEGFACCEEHAEIIVENIRRWKEENE